MTWVTRWLAALLLGTAALWCAPTCRLQLASAQANISAQRFAPALADTEQCLAEEPLHSAALVLKGNLLYLLGRDAEAITLLEDLVRREPFNSDGRYALGRVYYFNARPDPACAQFEAIVAAQPDHYRAWDNLGLAREAAGRIPEAIQAHIRAISLVATAHRGYDWAHANLAELLMKEDDNRRAFNLAVEAAERNPQSSRNFYLAGKALTRLEQWPKAERWLRRSAELDPTDAAPHYLLAQLYRRLERPAEADAERKLFLELQAKAPDKRR
jgi:tetratricopeptide (TPR) repeat protein